MTWRRAVLTGWRAILGGLLLAGSPSASPAQSAPAKKVAASIARVFGAGAGADTIPIEGSSVLRVGRDGAPLGFAIVRNVMGKDQPITFLVATDTALVLRDVDILVYREAYGGEVAYEPWRRQFRGKSAADSLRPGRDIRGISGATISVNAVTSAVRKALGDFARWRGEGKL